MKIFLIAFGIFLTTWLKNEWNPQATKKIDVTNLYKIEYKRYNITLEEINMESNLDDQTSKIFELMRVIDDKYKPRIFGGWVRDKLANHLPRDLDISIRATNISDLLELNINMIKLLKSKSENLNDINQFEIPIKIRGYGHEKVRLWGREVDINIMASDKIIVPPYQFTPTDNLTLDAMARDITVNAIYYNLKNNSIIDPVNGIRDLQDGLIITPFEDHPFKKDFSRVFRVFKTSAELSLRISDYIVQYIEENKSLIKNFLFSYKNQTIEKGFKRITAEENSLKAFKYIYDFDMMDVLIPDKYLDAFHRDKTRFSNIIFNYILISEFIIREKALSDILDKNETSLEFDKFNLYLGAIDKSFNGYKNEFLRSKSEDILNKIEISKTKFLLNVAESYCMIDRNHCEKSILSSIRVKQLNKILSKTISISRITNDSN